MIKYPDGNSQLEALRLIRSRRLNLVASTRELINKDLENAAQLAEALSVATPKVWPPDLNGPAVMRFALMQLDDPAEQG